MSHILVTGGASGIGAATAQHLAAQGSRVSILDRTGSDADTAAWWHELAPDRRGTWAVCDAADADALEAAVDAIAAHGITGLVACAGISVKEPFLDSTLDVWRSTLDINVLGTVIAARSVARALVAAGRGGAIVTVASTAGYGYVNGLGAHYHASKGAILALTGALATELGPYGIRVNSVAPGLIATPITEFLRAKHGEAALTAPVPQRALGEPAEVARAIEFLLSADASMITGHSLPVDGGQLAVAGQPLGGFADIRTERTAGGDLRPAPQHTIERQ
ncbi:SDR family NAD(P)-dependent oxidoreductase [Microbacterium sp. 1.5R]|uniref:SDR family NAD(P)-dependent oxidoreductase n=1 Tax=Microbacterium sp. 1.5R TaxID=1916917 RepID=UPI0016429B02|nr:SDR family oxidoreductase [Microbacterium sp. 1.5R]